MWPLLLRLVLFLPSGPNVHPMTEVVTILISWHPSRITTWWKITFLLLIRDDPILKNRSYAILSYLTFQTKFKGEQTHPWGPTSCRDPLLKKSSFISPSNLVWRNDRHGLAQKNCRDNFSISIPFQHMVDHITFYGAWLRGFDTCHDWTTLTNTMDVNCLGWEGETFCKDKGWNG